MPRDDFDQREKDALALGVQAGWSRDRLADAISSGQIPPDEATVLGLMYLGDAIREQSAAIGLAILRLDTTILFVAEHRR